MNKTVIVNLGSIDQIAPGHGLCFVVDALEIAVFRSRKGELFAIENRCPHRQGPLSEGVMGDGKIVCPLHGHKFNLKTGQGGEAQECLNIFKTWEHNGQIQLEISAKSVCVT